MLRVTVRFDGVQGGPWFNVTHWLNGDTQVGAQAAVDRIAGFWDAVDALMDNDCTWATDSAVDLVGFDNAVISQFATTPHTGIGAVAAAALPQATQALVQLRTGVFQNGREIRGRIFVPGLTVNALANDGNLIAAAKTTIEGAANALQAWTAPDLSVFSRTGSAAAVVQATAVPSEFAVLRSRRD